MRVEIWNKAGTRMMVVRADDWQEILRPSVRCFYDVVPEEGRIVLILMG